MNTKILEYIIAIAQERSISRAAERFYLTQPVLSRHLKKIEDELGAPLFVRQRDGMTLTEAGRIYINSAQNILHLEAELESDLRAMRAEEKNTLRVYVDFLDTDQLTQQILPPFREQYRDVRVRFVHMGTEEIQSYLSSGEKGIGILTAVSRRVSGLEYVTLYEDEQVVVKPADGDAMDTVFMMPLASSLRARQNRWLEQAGVRFATVMEAASFQSALDGAQMGQGCACALRSLAEKAGLTSWEKVPPAPFRVSAVYPRDMVFRPAALALLQAIIGAGGGVRRQEARPASGALPERGRPV